MLDKYNRLPYNYQSKTSYDTPIQKIVLKEIINLLGATIVAICVELKLKISRRKYLESKYFSFFCIINGS